MADIRLDKESHEKIEKILTKIAEEHNIDHVAAIDISLNKDNGLIKFKQAGPADWAYNAFNPTDAAKQNPNTGTAPLTPEQRDQYYKSNPGIANSVAQSGQNLDDATIQNWLTNQASNGVLQSDQNATNPPAGGFTGMMPQGNNSSGFMGQIQQAINTGAPGGVGATTTPATTPTPVSQAKKVPDTFVTDASGKAYYEEHNPDGSPVVTPDGYHLLWDNEAKKKIKLHGSVLWNTQGQSLAMGPSQAGQTGQAAPGTQAAPAANPGMNTQIPAGTQAPAPGQAPQPR